MSWAAFHAPNQSVAERCELLTKLNAGFTDAEQEEIAKLMPYDTHEIVRKPSCPKPRPYQAPSRAMLNTIDSTARKSFHSQIAAELKKRDNELVTIDQVLALPRHRAKRTQTSPRLLFV